MRALKTIGVVLLGCVLALIPLSMAFFYYMSLGDLVSAPPGGQVTVAFSRSPQVRRVMSEICQSSLLRNELAPEHYKLDYEELVAAGSLARVPDQTPVVVIESAGTFSGTLATFTFRRGPF